MCSFALTACGESSGAAGTDATVTTTGCLTDEACPGQICDPLTRACVACLTDAQCGTYTHCLAQTCVPFTSCSNSLDCVPAKGADGNAQPICDKSIGECTACLTTNDCPEFSECVAKQCKSFTPCQNSTQCGSDQVCDPATSRCTQCVSDADCTGNSKCEGGACRAFVGCVSDKDCTPMGMLCDTGKGMCARCLVDGDCPDVYNCQKTAVSGTGQCVLDVCKQGQGQCAGGKLVSCQENGGGFGSAQACAASTTCAAKDGLAACVDWACTPGKHCVGTDLVQCSVDGLEVLKTQKCGDGETCIGEACVKTVCTPNATYCEANAVKKCAADGLTTALVKACSLSEVCDAGACKAKVCEPNAAVCDGQKPAVCNATGTGFASEEAACAGGQICASGKCVSQLCAPATLFCDGGALKTCAPDGMSATKSVPCGSGNYCGTNKQGDASCLPVVCDPGKALCQGNVATACNADGSGFSSAATDCQVQGQVCSSGSCVSPLCDPKVPLYCDGQTAMKCDATGLNPTELAICQPAQYCEAGVCKAQVCTPSANFCSGNKPVTCNATGSAVASAGADCGSGATCANGACVTHVCNPLTPKFCDGQVAKTCSADGLTAGVVTTCGLGTYCAAGGCETQACTPSANFCSGNKPATCNATGSAVSSVGTDCGTGATCLGGACVQHVCVPATVFCDGSLLKTCAPDGLSVSKSVSCGAGTYCGLGKTGDAGCQAQVCTPGEPVCDGATAAVCNADGSGVSAGGVDCKAAGKACSGGACLSLACDPLQPKYCDGQTSMQCDATGLVATPITVCSASAYCETGVCKAQVCSPNASLCVGNKPATCNANGSAVATVGADCGSNATCSGGMCVPHVCTPATLFCDGSSLKTCAPDGLSVSKSQLCGGGFYCGSDALGNAGCQANVCAPGAPLCNGAVATVCSADGSGLVGGGVNCADSGKLCSAGACVVPKCDPQKPTDCDDANVCTADSCDPLVGCAHGAIGADCGVGKVCDAGVCLDQVCKPSLPYCDAGKVKLCAADGLSGLTTVTCTASQYCDAASVTCKAQVCVPNAATCSGNKPATCNADGSGFVGVGADCGVGKACDPTSGTCKTQVCGNGVVEGTEGCDDGNTVGGDFCAADCSALAATTTVVWSGTDAVAGAWSVLPKGAACGSTLTPGGVFTTKSVTGVPWGNYGTVAVPPANITAAEEAPNLTLGAAGIYEVQYVGRLVGQYQEGLEFRLTLSDGTIVDLERWVWNSTSEAAVNTSVQAAGGATWLNYTSTSGNTGGTAKNYRPWGWYVGSDTGWFQMTAKVNTLTDTIDFTFEQPSLSATPRTAQYKTTMADYATAQLKLTPHGNCTTVVQTGEFAGMSVTRSSLPTPPKVCSPNAPTCLGNLAGTCNAAGTGLVSATDCAVSGQTCSAGLCLDQVCKPSLPYCDAGKVKLCAADGLSGLTTVTCTASQYCDAASVTCKAQVCVPNGTGCNGAVVATCNADGSGWLAGGTDCAASGKVCSVAAGGCVSGGVPVYAIRATNSSARISVANAGFGVGSGAWTFEFWMKINGDFTATGGPDIFYMNETYGVNRIGFSLPANSVLGYTYNSSGGSFNISGVNGTNGGMPITAGDKNWHHVAMVYNGAGTVWQYLDGAKLSTQSGVAPVINATAPMSIGWPSGYPKGSVAPVSLGGIRYSKVARYAGVANFTPASTWTVDTNTIAQFLTTQPLGTSLVDEAGGDNKGTLDQGWIGETP